MSWVHLRLAALFFVEPGEAIETADEILARPEYREKPPTLIRRAVDWIFEQLAEAVGSVFGLGGGYWIGYAVLAMAAGAVLYFAWRVFPRGRRGAVDEEYTIDRETTTRVGRDGWLARAATAEAAARWSEAVHARYHALTSGLADEAQLPDAESTTSGEHREAFANVSDNPERVGRFADVIERYERIWFGGDDADRPDSDAVKDADGELLG